MTQRTNEPQKPAEFTVPKTNKSPLKMDGWKVSFLLGKRPIFWCVQAVSFGEGTYNFRFGGFEIPKSPYFDQQASSFVASHLQGSELQVLLGVGKNSGEFEWQKNLKERGRYLGW